MASELTRFETVQDMAAGLALDTIVYYEVHGKLTGPPSQDEGPLPVETDWGVRVRHSGDEFGVRFRVSISAAQGELLVDVAAEYVAEAEIEAPSEAVAFEFINNVAIMQIFPYVRETVSSLSTRVFASSLLLPVFERGQLQFTTDDAVDVESD